MESITLGPFSFIINKSDLKRPNYVKNTITDYINVNTNLKIEGISKIIYDINLLEITKSYNQNEFNYNFEIIVKSKSISERYKNLQKKIENQDSEIQKLGELSQELSTNGNINKNVQIILNIMRRPLLLQIDGSNSSSSFTFTSFPKLPPFYIYDKIREEPQIAFENSIARFGGTKHLTDPDTVKAADELKYDTYGDTFKKMDDSSDDIYSTLFNQGLLKENHPLVIVTHHAKIRKNLIPLNPPNPGDRPIGFQNCCIIKMELTLTKPTNDSNPIEVRTDYSVKFKGTNEKDTKYHYVSPDYNLNTMGINRRKLNNDIQKIDKDKLKKPVTVYHIYIIRHGNGLHNPPFKLKNTFARFDEERGNNDSPLTIYGMLQAILAGKHLKNAIDQNLSELDYNNNTIFCTSTLNRAQCTGLLMYYSNLIPELNELFSQPEINLELSFKTLMKILMGEKYKKTYFDDLLKVKDRGELQKHCQNKLSSLKKYREKLDNDKLLSLTCYFIHCSIARMLFLSWHDERYNKKSVTELFDMLKAPLQSSGVLNDPLLRGSVVVD